ncbi:hypothetical protein [Methanocalculus sp.]|uniref:hypothetical protein n=1 Tax=Methanocalculus sp. TaxID=2004547 RepID=UPI00261CB1C6|nr:hypothetical protein [Methanocalculus sp.]MDG6251166.1 hypothetical protein [Methanocalculus sp.]
MYDDRILVVVLICSLLFCTMCIVSASALVGNVDGSSPGDEIWMDGTPPVSEIFKELNETYPFTENLIGANSLKKEGYSIGDEETFDCSDMIEEKLYRINATCEAVGDYCYIFVEENQILPEANAIADVFDDVIYPEDTKIFGNPRDVDGISRIFILFLDFTSESDIGESESSCCGYFHPKIGDTTDIIHINVDNPEDEIKSTIAHEFQHLIHYRHDPNETRWINEGCAMYASFACLDVPQYSHVYEYMRLPDAPLVAADVRFLYTRENMAHYGASYLWTLYLSENFGDLSNRSGHEGFIKDLVENKEHGIPGIDATLALHGYEERFDDIFKQWVVANYLESEGKDPPLGYASLNLPHQPPARAGRADLRELDVSTFSFPEKKMHSWSAAYYEIKTDDPERITCTNDRGFWNTSFVNEHGNVVIVISPLDDHGNVTLTVSEEHLFVPVDFDEE